MRKIMILLSVIGFTGCKSYMSPERDTNVVNDMQCPVILLAEVAKTEKTKGAIVLVDGNGDMYEFMCTKAFGAAIADSYEVGDTIEFCKR